MKKIIILKHGGGELANQLWNYLSVSAYGLEVGVPVKNPSFFEYHSFFKFLPQESAHTRFLSIFFKTPRRRSHPLNKIGRAVYLLRSKTIGILKTSCVYSSENMESKTVDLPPTHTLPEKFMACENLYLTGWLFRNNVGLTKFSKELRMIFTPKSLILDRIDAITRPLKAANTRIIGVHIRQSDYESFKNGKFAISQERVRTIIDEYVTRECIDLRSTVFLIASDGKINGSVFSGLNTYISRENSVIDLFLLSRTDVILGSDSSFGSFASWYGNIPHIILKNEPIDWKYYQGKTGFFENTQSTLAKY